MAGAFEDMIRLCTLAGPDPHLQVAWKGGQ